MNISVFDCYLICFDIHLVCCFSFFIFKRYAFINASIVYQRTYITLLQSLEAGWVTSRQIEAAVFYFVFSKNIDIFLNNKL
jgi:hypothetical protein